MDERQKEKEKKIIIPFATSGLWFAGPDGLGLLSTVVTQVKLFLEVAEVKPRPLIQFAYTSQYSSTLSGPTILC